MRSNLKINSSHYNFETLDYVKMRNTRFFASLIKEIRVGNDIIIGSIINDKGIIKGPFENLKELVKIEFNIIKLELYNTVYSKYKI